MVEVQSPLGDDWVLLRVPSNDPNLLGMMLTERPQPDRGLEGTLQPNPCRGELQDLSAGYLIGLSLREQGGLDLITASGRVEGEHESVRSYDDWKANRPKQQ